MHAVLANPRPPLPVAAGTLGTAARALFLRAVTAGGALWTLLFFALWATLALLSGEPDVHDLRKPTEIVFPPPGPPLLPPPEPARPAAPVAPPHEIGAPVPAPGETPIPEAPEPPAPPDGDGRSGAGEWETPAGSVDPSSMALPGPTDYVVHDVEPEVVLWEKPAYPDLAHEAGVEGTVVLRALVGADGRVKDVRVLRSVPLLDEAAAAAVRRWVFHPAFSGPHAIAVWVSLRVRFTLR